MAVATLSIYLFVTLCIVIVLCFPVLVVMALVRAFCGGCACWYCFACCAVKFLEVGVSANTPHSTHLLLVGMCGVCGLVDH